MSDSTRKPHNYFDELTPAQKEEYANMEAAAAEVKRVKEIGDTQRIFGKIEKIHLANGNPPEIGNGKQKEKKDKPSTEEVAIARGLIKIHPPIMEVKRDVDH